MTSLFVRIDMVMELPFRELRSPPCAPPPVFLSLFDPRVPSQEACLLQGILQLGIILEQGLRNPVTDGDRLARHSAALNIHRHVELILGPGDFERLKDDHFTGLPAEELLQCPFFITKLPLSGFKPDPGNRGLSLSCSVNRFCHGLLLPPFSFL